MFDFTLFIIYICCIYNIFYFCFLCVGVGVCVCQCVSVGVSVSSVRVSVCLCVYGAVVLVVVAVGVLLCLYKLCQNFSLHVSRFSLFALQKLQMFCCFYFISHVFFAFIFATIRQMLFIYLKTI